MGTPDDSPKPNEYMVNKLVVESTKAVKLILDRHNYIMQNVPISLIESFIGCQCFANVLSMFSDNFLCNIEIFILSEAVDLVSVELFEYKQQHNIRKMFK